MVKEVRCIVLDRNDVRLAVGECHELRDAGHDATEIARVDLAHSAEGTYGTVHFHASAHAGVTTIAPTELLMAVLLFCNRHRIPLPMRGAKSLGLIGDKLVLDVKKG